MPTGAAYLDVLTSRDLALLDEALGGSGEPARFAEHPDRIEPALGNEATFAALFDEQSPSAPVSPRLLFAVVVHRGALEVAGNRHVTERVGARMLVPVFDGDRLAAFAADQDARLFLVQLLSSFTKVASGARWERHGGRLRKRRFSELEPSSMAELVVSAPAHERPAIWRRMGDLALFSTGVFPDHAAKRTLTSIELNRVLRSIPTANRRPLAERLHDLDALDPLLRTFGPIWYRLAGEARPARPRFLSVHTPPTAAVTTPAELMWSSSQPARPVAARMADDFDVARRFLGFLADRYLFTRRSWLFPWQN